jgi:D-amino-acid dehydrogenase
MKTAIVVGSGIAGASAAYELLRRGYAVTLADADIAGRATDAGAGIISPLGTTVPRSDVLEFSMRAAAHYVRLVARFGEAGKDTSFYRTAGKVLIALDDDEVTRLKPVSDRIAEAVGQYGSEGIGTPADLDQDEIRRRFPLFGNVLQAVYLPEIGQVDGRALRRHLLAELTEGGAALVAGIAALEVNDSGAASVRLGVDLLHADAVVVAAGAWSGHVLGAFLGTAFVEPQRGQILHMHLPGIESHPSANGFRGHYLLSFPGDRLVVGATREDGSGFGVKTTMGGIEQVLAHGRQIIATVDQAAWIEVRVGIRPKSADGLPIVGKVPGAANLWAATGYGPQGLTLGTFTGHEIAALIDGAAHSIPESFSPSRFASGA